MKKYLIILFSVVAFLRATAQEPIVEISTRIANQGSYVADYSSEFKLCVPGSVYSWTAKNFNNNNSAWDNIRCGSKTSATTATITTDFAIERAIERVEVEVSRYKSGSTNRMTSMSILVSPNEDMTDATVYEADINGLPSTTGVASIIEIDIAQPLENMFYQLRVEMPKVSSEGVFSVNSLKYYEKEEIVEGLHDVSLDFSNKQSLLDLYAGANSIEPGSAYAESGANNLNGARFSLTPVGITINKASGTIQPRWWQSSTIAPELRLNPQNTITFRICRPGYKLQQVKFVKGTAADSYFEGLSSTVAVTNLGNAVFEDAEWSASAGDMVNMLTLTFNDYCRCCGINIAFIEDDTALAAIDDIQSATDDRDVEYYNLQGLKVGAADLLPGMYIRRCGRSVEKIVVRGTGS